MGLMYGARGFAGSELRGLALGASVGAYLWFDLGSSTRLVLYCEIRTHSFRTSSGSYIRASSVPIRLPCSPCVVAVLPLRVGSQTSKHQRLLPRRSNVVLFWLGPIFCSGVIIYYPKKVLHWSLWVRPLLSFAI